MEEVEARNRLDGIVYQAEKTIRENRDKLGESEVKQAEEALEEAKKAMTDGGVASASLQTLARAPQQTLPLLQQHVKPVSGARLAKLLLDLDNDQFEVREAAAKELVGDRMAKRGASVEEIQAAVDKVAIAFVLLLGAGQFAGSVPARAGSSALSASTWREYSRTR